MSKNLCQIGTDKKNNKDVVRICLDQQGQEDNLRLMKKLEVGWLEKLKDLNLLVDSNLVGHKKVLLDQLQVLKEVLVLHLLAVVEEQSNLSLTSFVLTVRIPRIK